MFKHKIRKLPNQSKKVQKINQSETLSGLALIFQFGDNFLCDTLPLSSLPYSLDKTIYFTKNSSQKN